MNGISTQKQPYFEIGDRAKLTEPVAYYSKFYKETVKVKKGYVGEVVWAGCKTSKATYPLEEAQQYGMIINRYGIMLPDGRKVYVNADQLEKPKCRNGRKESVSVCSCGCH